MKVKYIITLYLLGMILLITGALTKILHLPLANFILSAGSFLEAAACFIAIVKIFTSEKYQDFLNS